MCSAESPISMDIEEGDLITIQFKCLDCNSKFRGIGKKMRCPSCQSANVTKV